MSLFAVLLATVAASQINAILPVPCVYEHKLPVYSYDDTLAPHPVLAPLGEPGEIPVDFKDEEGGEVHLKYLWDGKRAYLVNEGNGDHKKGIAIKLGKKKYWIWANGKPVWFHVDEGAREWEVLMGIPGEGPPGGFDKGGGSYEGNGDSEKYNRRRLFTALAFYGLFSFWLGFFFYLLRDFDGQWIALASLGGITILWLSVRIWLSKSLGFFLRIIALYWGFGLLMGILHVREQSGGLAVGSVIGTLSIALLSLMTIRLLGRRKYPEYFSGFYEPPRPVDPPGKYDLATKIASGVVWFLSVIALYLTRNFDLAFVLFVSVAIPYFIYGVFFKLYERYSNISVRVTQIPRLERREPEHRYQAWIILLQRSLKVMLGFSVLLWIVIFIVRFNSRNLFVDPLLFLLSFLFSFGLWRIFWAIFGRLK